MTIDRGTFANKWLVLEDRFGEQYSDPVRNQYFESLSPRLSTEEFVEACEVLFYGNRFFPTPAEFVEAVRGGGDREAEEEWQKVVARVEAKRQKERPPEGTEIKGAALRALRAIGGLSAVREADAAWVSRLRREFIDAFENLREEPRPPSLPSPEDGPRRELPAEGES